MTDRQLRALRMSQNVIQYILLTLGYIQLGNYEYTVRDVKKNIKSFIIQWNFNRSTYVQLLVHKTCLITHIQILHL